MNKCAAYADAVKRAGDEVGKAIAELDQPDSDFDYFARKALLAMQAQVKFSALFQETLDAGELMQELEVYTSTTLPTGLEKTFTEYWRLMPGTNEPSPLSGGMNGYSDPFTASRERRDAWPDAFYISPALFNSAVSEKYRTEHDYYRDSFQVGTHRRGRF